MRGFVNAACEGRFSYETAVTVREFVLPLCVDYIVYYEGANQLQKNVLRHLVVEEGDAVSRPDLPGLFDARSAAVDGEGRWLYEHSALARRAHTVSMGSELLAEPKKPQQRLELPDGLADGQVDLSRADELLDLATILRDLQTISDDATAVGARLVLCSFQFLVHEGMRVHPVRGEHIYRDINGFYWPIRYAHLRTLVDLQNAWFRAWAESAAVDFLDTAAAMSDDHAYYVDSIHKSEIGSRMHGWVTFPSLLPLIKRDLQRGVVPVPDREPAQRHPAIGPMRRVSIEEFERSK